MQTQPLPAPFRGIDQKTPQIALQSPFCRYSLNFHSNNIGYELRSGDIKYSRFAFATGAHDSNKVLVLANYGSSKVILVAFSFFDSWIRFYDATTGSMELSVGTVTAQEWQTLYFNKYLFFFTSDLGLAPGKYYEGTGGTYGDIGYVKKTGTVGLFKPFGGNAYKNRAYMIQHNEPAYWYGGIDAIAGECPKVQLGMLTEEPSNLACICSFTLSDQVSAVAVQTFVFANGEIFFYTGSYPDSSDWTIVGKAKIPQPLYWNSVVSISGDSLVITDNGLYSMRDLFLKGSQNANVLSLSENIEPLWRDLIVAARANDGIPSGPLNRFISGTYDEKNSKIVIELPYIYNDGVLSLGSTSFIYDMTLNAWTLHQRSIDTTFGTRDTVYFQGKLLQLWQSGTTHAFVSEREAGQSYVDRRASDVANVSYSYVIQSAPISNNNGLIQLISGMDLIIESDLYDSTSYKLIKNFGVQTTGTQKTNAPTGLQQPFVNIGIEGNYVQYELTGDTQESKTVGLKLYGTNIWIEEGQSPR